MPLIEIRCTDGESFNFECPDDLWIEVLAYAQSTGLQPRQIIVLALERFFGEWHELCQGAAR